LNTFSDLVLNGLPQAQVNACRNAYSGKLVVVTGGASFIGSHLVEVLVQLGAVVRVIDDLSSGKQEFIPINENIEFKKIDLRFREVATGAFKDAEIVFHLAAIHGGRGFIENFQQDISSNFAIDNNVFSAVDSTCKMVVHASSACAYPTNLQISENKLEQLAESQASTENSAACFPDGLYGWTKLMGEYQLEHQVSRSSTRGRSARIFTAYGERENESHAAIALMAKAIFHADPYPIWGSGQQTRNFTYVADTVSGLLLIGADHREINFDVFNVGASQHIKVIDFAEAIFENLGWKPSTFDFQLDKPVGVASRSSDNTKIKSIFGWEPSTSLLDGISRTMSWYRSYQNAPGNLEELELRLLAR
jgi:nucleoside-diphosphate-sugar epimerase